ncbi:MAG: PKD domain-containing protein [Thermoplasmata archaeon]
MVNYMTRHASIILALGLVAPLLVVYAPPASAANITKTIETFDGVKSEIKADFQYGGTDKSNALSIQTGLIIQNASLKTTTAELSPDRSDYPTNVSVDFGGDQKPEWAFVGKGYGSWGLQDTFPSGSKNISLTCGLNGTTSTSVYLPQKADVKKANMTIKSAPLAELVELTGGTSTNVYPFGSGTTWRFQWLYTAAEIKGSGIIDKVGWKVQSGYGIGGSGTLTGFKMLFCNTPITGLTTTFANNYGGNTPQKVIDTASYDIKESGGWLEIDPPDEFFYDNSKNLLIEISFTGKTGTSFGLAAGTVSDGTGARRAWSSSSADSPTGSVDSSAYRYDVRIYISGKAFNLSVDICNDTVIDYQTTTPPLNGTEVVFTEALRDFMTTAEVNFTDPYGNAFVAFPIIINMQWGGKITLLNMSIVYESTAEIRLNPYDGDLATSLNELMSTKQGPENLTIPIYISSTTPGRVWLHSLKITAVPPIHAPTIKRFWPDEETQVEENTELEFGIDVEDIYGNPVSIQWYYNEEPMEGETGSRIKLFFDYDSAGLHTVKVRVENGLRAAEQRWNITVVDINREPVIESHLPVTNPTVRENETVEFSVEASDPDGDPLSYQWSLDRKVQMKENGSRYRYTPDFFSAGTHTVMVTVSDPGGLTATKKWDVTVENVNVAPVIVAYSPKTNPRIRETQSWTFSATGADQDEGTLLTMTWYLDGAQVYIGESYTYKTNFKSAGQHKVKVVVSDGELSDSYEWLVTVDNWNRAPEPVIDSPRERLEYIEGEQIQFSAVSSSDPDEEELTYVWKEGDTVLSSEAQFQTALPRGLHTIVLEVTDVMGAKNSTSVRVRVRYVEIAVIMGLSRMDIRAGDRVEVIVTVTNIGDAPAAELSVELLVDGRSLGTESIPALGAGETVRQFFQWKAVKGEHTFTAKIGESSWEKVAVVEPAPPVEAGAGVEAYLWPLLIIVLIVLLIAWGAVVMRKK